MSTRRSIIALLRLLHEELAELVEVSYTADLRVVDAFVRNVEGDVERVRQELDALLRPRFENTMEGEPTR